MEIKLEHSARDSHPRWPAGLATTRLASVGHVGPGVQERSAGWWGGGRVQREPVRMPRHWSRLRAKVHDEAAGQLKRSSPAHGLTQLPRARSAVSARR